MSRGFTEAEAAAKECPFRGANGPDWLFRFCTGSRCMLWERRPTGPSVENHMTMLPFVAVAGAIVPSVAEQTPGERPEVSAFPVPDGDGWEPSEVGPVYRENRGCWTLNFTRKLNPEPRGVCGCARNGEAA